MSEIDYKSKYQQLKLKFMNSVDIAFRLGYEQGMQGAQMQQMQEAQAQQQAMEQQAAQGQMPGEEGGEQPQEAEAGPTQEHPDGSELDQHIAKLESMISKSEPDTKELAKALNGIKAYKQKIDISKAQKTIDSIGKSMKKFQLGSGAKSNLNDNAKKALTMQEKIVGNIMKSWDDQENKASKNILDVLKAEGLAKKE